MGKDMEMRELGSTGIRVSEIGFGAWGIGGVAYRGGLPRGWPGASAEQSLAALRRAWECGINFYDTADVYGAGKSEVLLGLALGERKKDAVIATKCGHGMVLEEINTTPDYILGALDSSLTRLERDWIDIYMIHSPPLEYFTDEAFSTLDKLKKAGKIRAWGASVHRVEDALRVIEGGGQVVELVYNLLALEVGQGVFAAARAGGVGIVAREALANGLLNGSLTEQTVFPPEDHRSKKFPPERIKAIARRLSRLDWLESEGLTLPKAALRFVLGEPAVSSVIVGCRTAAHVESNCAEAGQRLGAGQMRRLTEALKNRLSLV
ncbi:aldo/keto reductase [Desulfovibrio sp. OttesenSCG-928-C14]|nr:aldo/keto reductase [Desulfovibrio sp. OttesenSCG-928-C14]